MENCFEKEADMTFTKMDKADLYSPRGEFFVGGLGFVIVALSVRWYVN